MSYSEYLSRLVAPLGIYNGLEGLQGAEWKSIGRQLDMLEQEMEHTQQEMNLLTAQDFGLEQVTKLFARRPVTQNTQQLVNALAALLRLGGDSFTLDAINDTIGGCGINAVAEETDAAGTVRVYFPDVAGVPDGFEEICEMIEGILPAHLAVHYHFWYINWRMLEERFASWAAIEEMGLSWKELEVFVR